MDPVWLLAPSCTNAVSFWDIGNRTDTLIVACAAPTGGVPTKPLGGGMNWPQLRLSEKGGIVGVMMASSTVTPLPFPPADVSTPAETAA